MIHIGAAIVTGTATVSLAIAHLNIIYGVPFAPDGNSTLFNMAGDYTDVDEDPYDLDANWITVVNELSFGLFMAEMPDSLQHKVIVGVDLHSLAVAVRKNASGGTDPAVSVQLYNGAAPKEAVIDTETVTSDVSEVHTGTFGLQPPGAYDNLPFFRVGTFAITSGDRNIDIGAVRVYLAMEGTRINASVSGAATVTLADGGLIKSGAADVTGVCTITDATGGLRHIGAASVGGAATIRAWASLNMILGVPFSPDGQAFSTNVTGDWTDLVDDPFNIDANWVEAILDDTFTFLFLDFPDSLHAKVIKSPNNYHTLVITVRKSAAGTDPDIIGLVFDNFGEKERPIDSEPVSNLTSEIFEGTFNLFDSIHAFNFRIVLQGIPVDTATVDFGAVRVYLAMEGTRIEASVSGAASVLASGGLIKIADASVTGVGDITADANLTLVGVTSVTGIATVTLATAKVLYSAGANVTGIATTNADADVTYGLEASVTGSAIVSADSAVTYGLEASVTGVAIVNADAGLTISADADATGIGNISAIANLTLAGVTSVTGIATVSANGNVEFGAYGRIISELGVLRSIKSDTSISQSIEYDVSFSKSIRSKVGIQRSIRTSSRLTKSIHIMAEVA